MMTMQELWQWGINLILLLQTFEDWLQPMRLLTFTGNTEFFLLILPTLYWLVNRKLGVRVATLLLLSIVLGSILKLAFHGPRPYWIDARVQLLAGDEATFGLPSIHTMNAVAMWGGLALYMRRLWAWGLALLFMLASGIARVYLGVHFPTDVIAGWLIGLLLLGLWQLMVDPIGRWYAIRTPLQQRITATTFSIALILIAAIIRLFVVTTWDPMVDWAGRWPQEPLRLFLAFSLADVITGAAVFAGMVSGLLLCRRIGSFETRGTVAQKLGRYLLGVVGVLLLWQGLDLVFTLFAADESTLGYALRYIRYSLIGFWIFGLAPLLFRQFRLAEREFI